MPNRQSTDRLLAQAQRAIEQDQLDNARVLLEAAARQDAADARPWLLLAGIATSTRERRTFLAQADRLKTSPAALAPAPLSGAPRRATAAGAVPATVAYAAPRRNGPNALMRTGLLVAVLLAMAVGVYLFAQSPVGDALVQDITGGPATQPEAVLAAADATPTETTSATAQPTDEPALPTPTLAVSLAAGRGDALAPGTRLATGTPAAEPPLLPEKEVAAAGQSLSTWTVTPEPTPTLAPTATPTATPEPTATLEPPPPGSPRPLAVGPTEKWIDVNLTTQTLTAFEGDTPVLSTLISSGQWQYATVTGEFRTYLKYDLQTMSGYHLGLDYVTTDVPHVMYFYRDFAIHGAYWHNSFGTPVSHGCVNAPPPEAAWLYSWAPVGTFVTVHN